ncbi:MAG: glycosyltransferase family 2 protein [Pseudomonadota bacterium]
MTTWGTVTLADEPRELLLAFAAYHLRRGASAVYIYLDRPDRALAAELSTLPDVYVTQCDEPFWYVHGGRPPIQTRRQDIVANLAYQAAQVDWLAHIDADEFVHGEGPFDLLLNAVPADISCLRLPVRERAWPAGLEPETIFDGVFRAPIPGKLGLDRHVLRHLSRFTQRGLTGHTRGKTVARVGARLELSIHSPKHADDLDFWESTTHDLLHFDGLTPFHWLLKRLRYAALPHADQKLHTDHYRWNQINKLREFPTVWEARRFQRRLTTLGTAAEAQARALGFVGDAPGFDPAGDLARLMPEVAADFTVEHFDACLKARDADLVEALGLEPTE